MNDVMYVPIEFNGETIEVLVDSGASHSFIAKSLVQALALPVREEAGKKVKLANGAILDTNLYVRVNIVIKGKVFSNIKFNVLEV
jgi:predicted aspartyl protease